MSDPGNIEGNESDRPGIMGNETEEQSLGQAGKPGARITEDEVDEAFDGELDDEGAEDRQLAFWKGFAWGVVATLAGAWVIQAGRSKQRWYY